jgi:hypothetical protein
MHPTLSSAAAAPAAYYSTERPDDFMHGSSGRMLMRFGYEVRVKEMQFLW